MCFPKRNNLKKILISISSDNSGAVAVIIGICLVALMIATALAVDVGSLFEDRRMLYTVADSAALAGAQELPENPGEAINKATEYANNNYSEEIESINVEISSTLATNDTITVTVFNPDSPLYFARVMNMESTPVGATATAIVASPRGVNNLVPWGASIPEGVDWEDWLSYGDPKTLKFGAGDSFEGNFYALNLSDDPVHGGGASEYLDYIRNGYPGTLEVGDEIWTRTGNIVKTVDATKDRAGPVEGWLEIEDLAYTVINPETGEEEWVLNKASGQFVVVPVIYELEDPTGQELVEILAFAPFILTEIKGSGGHSEIVGQFIDQALIITTGGIDAVGASGLRVIRLIK